MLQFKKLTYKNFLSVGNKPLTIDFLKNKKKIFTGKNGHGKSIMQDALCFALYNRSFRKSKKEQLVNSINKKNLVVELEFRIGNKEYKIIRGIAPIFCELYIDGEKKEMEGSARDYQAFIENTILRMSEKTFRQIVVLGSTAYVPFMKLPTYIKRNVVEDLLEISIFSSMNDVIKQKSSIAVNKLSELMTDIKILETKINAGQEQIETLTINKESSKNKNKQEIELLEQDIEDFTKNLDDLHLKLNSLDIDAPQLLKDIQLIKAEIKQLHSLEAKIENNQARANKEVKFLEENDECHVCLQEIDNEFKFKIISDNKTKLIEFEEGITQLGDLILANENKIDKMNSDISQLNSVVNSIKNCEHKRKLKQEKLDALKSITESANEDNSKTIKQLKKTNSLLQKELGELLNEKQDLTELANCLTYLSNILKDDGIKSKIIKTYLPVINKLIRKYLDILDFNIDFRFDEHFDETIKAQYKDNFSYGNFSTGQQLRIDLSILFAWRELSKIKNSTATNLIILDEIHSSSLDSEGTEAFNNIIDLCVQEGESAVIITHAPETVSGNSEIVNFRIENNFTNHSVTLN